MQRRPRKFYFASESVGEGHPDKLCDQIADAVLDECIKKDKFAVAGLNAVTKCKIVSLMGETVVSSPTMGREQINYEDVMKEFAKMSAMIMSLKD